MLWLFCFVDEILKKSELDVTSDIESEENIHYVTGDATKPIADGCCIILNCLDNSGEWLQFRCFFSKVEI